MRKCLEIIMSVLVITMVLTAAVYYNTGERIVEASKKTEKKDEDNEKIDITIVIDAGHGGFDPGKVGINDELEKDINLAIALKLQKKCEEEGIKVIMTRTEDVDLAEEGTGKKTSDMRNRVEIINNANADFCISIHQNSYTSKEVKGAQVFYYSGSEVGKKLAGILQTSLVGNVDSSNHRKEKSNDSYYLLKNSICPSVIVECGFLSNWNEATNLKDEFYQEKIADAIYEGIIEYTKSNS